MANITWLAPYVSHLGWSSIVYRYSDEIMQCKYTEFGRVLKCAADKGSADAGWWLRNADEIDLILTNRFSGPDKFKDEEQPTLEDRARLHYFYWKSWSYAEHLYSAAALGNEYALFEWAARLHFPRQSLSEEETERYIHLLQKAALLGSFSAMRKLELAAAPTIPTLNTISLARDPARLALVREAALRGQREEIDILANFQKRRNLMKALLKPIDRDVFDCDYENNYDCYDPERQDFETGPFADTAEDALWLFMKLFFWKKGRYSDQERIDFFATVCRRVRGSEALYQFGSCAYYVFDFCESAFASALVVHVDRYKATNKRAKEAVNMWTLVGHRAAICPDIRRLIGKLIWADRVEWTVMNPDAGLRRSTRNRIK